MINAKDLRIGNWVAQSYDAEVWNYPGTMEQVTVYTLRDIEENPDHYVPIPLTPEILEKCGFDYDYDHSEKWFSSQIGYIGKCEGGYTLPDSDGEPSIGYVLESLHQLQNLYFALTGSEIEVNL